MICSLYVAILTPPLQACTIFTLTDTDRILFCNNEDWKEDGTRIWFVPGKPGSSTEKKTYGCAYVGFLNQWGQGGVNTEGLAFDWVAGFNRKWKQAPGMKRVNGNPAERMLESCASVEAAVHFFQTHWEPGFASGKIFIADRTGTSAIISAKDGRLDIRLSETSSGLGYGIDKVQRSMDKTPAPTLTTASSLLQKAIQTGGYPTQYSNVFDLKAGRIFIYQFSKLSKPVQLSLKEELNKGPHSYSIPRIQEQLNQDLIPLNPFKEWLKIFY